MTKNISLGLLVVLSLLPFLIYFRWWIAANASQNSAIFVGENILSQTKLEVDRLRNVFRFLLGNLPDDLDVKDLLPCQELLPIDRYILHCLALHCKQVDILYNQFLYNKVVQQTQFFVGSTLSSFYFDLVKDRLYCDMSYSKQRKSANTAMYHVLNNLQASISPILPVLCREVTLHSNSLSNAKCFKSSQFYQYSLNNQWMDNKLQDEMEFLINVKEEIKNLVRHAMGAEEAISTKDLNKLDVFIIPLSSDSKDNLAKFGCDELREIFQVATITICSSYSDFEKIDQNNVAEGSISGKENRSVKVKILDTKQKLCPRCRLYLTTSEDCNDGLCNRCEKVVRWQSL